MSGNQALVLIFAMVGVGRLLDYLVRARLRSAHQETWDALGTPSFRLDPRRRSPRATAADRSLLKFLLKREYASLADRRLTILCEAVRWYLVVFLITFAFVIWRVA